MEVKASHNIIKKLKRDNALLEEYEEAIIDKDDRIRKFEKSKLIADNVIKNLQEERNLQGNVLENAKQILKEKEHLITEKDSLEKEVLYIQKENNLKEEKLKHIDMEMNILKEKLSKFKEAKVNVDVDDKNIQTNSDYPKRVEKLNGPDCKICSESFLNTADLENHFLSEHPKIMLDRKLEELEKELVSERLKLSLKLVLLKEKENRKMGACNCRKHCRIFHTRFNWKRSESGQIFERMQTL